MGKFDIIDVVILLGIAQGLFLTVTLPIVHQKNKSANTILSLQLGMASLMLFTKLAVYKAEEVWVVQRVILIEPFIFLYGPLGYIYLKRLLEKNNSKYQLRWFHYLPALIYLGYLLYLNILPTDSFRTKWATGEFSIPFAIAETAALIHNLVFWYFCGEFVFRYSKNERQQLSFSQKTISFIKVIHIFVGFVLFLWCYSYLSGYFFGQYYSWITYDSTWIGIPVLIYIVGYYALRQPEIFRIQLVPEKEKNSGKNRLQNEEINTLTSRLEELIEKEKLYLNNELTLSDLSRELKTSTNNLSWLLNNIYQSNFYEYINKYRIQAFLGKVKNNEHSNRTLLSLSMEVGFNSKSTFNKAFKTLHNDTPSNYIKKMQI